MYCYIKRVEGKSRYRLFDNIIGEHAMATITIPPEVVQDLWPHFEGAQARAAEGRPDPADSVYLRIEAVRNSKPCRVDLTAGELKELRDQADYTIGPDSYVGGEPEYRPLKRDYQRLIKRIDKVL
jgi:hypothetical protein